MTQNNDSHTAPFSEAQHSLHSIRDFIRFSVTTLREHDVYIGQGTTDHFAEASALVLQTVSLDWSADPEILDARLTPSEKSAIAQLLWQRVTTRKPLSYLINLSYFCGLPFYVDERVLIPRSPIAELVKQQFFPYFQTHALAQPLDNKQFFNHGLPEKNLPQPSQILDLCTGSGCIALALAHVFDDAYVDATDIDDDALEVAAINVAHHECQHQVNLIKSDLFTTLAAQAQYDLIVTNPPYVDAQDMADLPDEYQYEPEHALAAGQDGLDLVHRILYDAPAYMSENGLLVVEVGNSAWALKQNYPDIHFHWLEFLNGGTGIFALTKRELLKHQEAFAACCSPCKT